MFPNSSPLKEARSSQIRNRNPPPPFSTHTQSAPVHHSTFQDQYTEENSEFPYTHAPVPSDPTNKMRHSILSLYAEQVRSTQACVYLFKVSTAYHVKKTTFSTAKAVQC